MNKKSRILIFDIETAPNLSYVWGMWEQNVIDVKKHWSMLTFSVKWLGEKKTYVYGLDDFKGYKDGDLDDSLLMKKLWEFIDEADVLVAHNGNAFDIKKFNARCIILGLKPPSPYKKIDTKLEARKYFKFDSNKLDHLGEYLGLGRKVSTGGFGLWIGCMNGEKKSWKLMKKYNKQDVILLEKVYLELRPWMENHPNQNLLTGKIHSCPKCQSFKMQKRGFGITRATRYQRWQCQNCGGWSQSPINNDKVIR